MRTFKDIACLSTLGLALAATTLPGCAALVVGAAAGVGTVAYVNGELDTVVEANMDDAWQATEAAIKDLEFTTTESKKDAISAESTSRTAQDKSVHIRLNRETDATTRVRIRVEVFGNEDLSRTILEKIKSHL